MAVRKHTNAHATKQHASKTSEYMHTSAKRSTKADIDTAAVPQPLALIRFGILWAALFAAV